MATPSAGRNGRLYMDTSTAANGSAVQVALISKFNIDRSTEEYDGQ